VPAKMDYEQYAFVELRSWKKAMIEDPSLLSELSKKLQKKINSYIPEKVHAAITTAIKQMTRSVLFGAKFSAKSPATIDSLQKTEEQVSLLIRQYRKTGAIEGGITGAGGILMGFADFPILIGIKFKLLFEIATLYGFDVKDYKERLYILHVFQLAFSSPEHRKKIFLEMQDWNQHKQKLPDDIHKFDWRSFQQEYRDYIDLAKMAQMIPGIGAVVGVIANYQLLNKLGETAMNAYRMRLYSV
jgi:hypothetical protein